MELKLSLAGVREYTSGRSWRSVHFQINYFDRRFFSPPQPTIVTLFVPMHARTRCTSSPIIMVSSHRRSSEFWSVITSYRLTVTWLRSYWMSTSSVGIEFRTRMKRRSYIIMPSFISRTVSGPARSHWIGKVSNALFRLLTEKFIHLIRYGAESGERN